MPASRRKPSSSAKREGMANLTYLVPLAFALRKSSGDEIIKTNVLGEVMVFKLGKPLSHTCVRISTSEKLVTKEFL